MKTTIKYTCNNSEKSTAFTLIEVLVSMVILAVILLVITSVIGQAQRTWKSATSKLSQFREARQAFETVSRGLRQAMLNTYMDYEPRPTPLTPPLTGVHRKADLGVRFAKTPDIVTGLGGNKELPGSAVVFQAPLGLVKDSNSAYAGLKDLLCARGYFVQFSDDSQYMPIGLKDRLQTRSRFRLIEYRPPTEENTLYASGSTSTSGWTDILGSEAQGRGYLRVVANNIVGMYISVSFNDAAVGGKRKMLGETLDDGIYKFDSYKGGGDYANRSTLYSMPVAAQLVMVAVDDESASRMITGGAAPDISQESGATFSDAKNMKRDIRSLRDYMIKQRYNFRIFSSIVFLPANEI